MAKNKKKKRREKNEEKRDVGTHHKLFPQQTD